MSNTTKNRPLNESGPNARPWKNSLLNKELPETLQNPINYFGKVIQDNDTFGILYEHILDKREKGEVLEYLDREDKKVKSVDAFLVVQDARGTHWICPVHIGVDNEPIDQKVSPLNLVTDAAEDAFRDTESFGQMVILQSDFISACSRGFENASRLFLGNRSVQLKANYSLIAAFYVFPKEEK
jgi:hypothetical protein